MIHHARWAMLLLLLPLSLGAAGSRPPGSRGAPPVVEAAPVAPSSALPAPARGLSNLGRTWIVGEQRRYAIVLDQKVGFRAAGERASHGGARVHVEGEWLVGVTGVVGDDIEVQARLEHARTRIEADGHDARNAQEHAPVLAGLAATHYATLNRQGAVRLVHLPVGCDPLAEGVFRTLLAETQLVSSGKAATWTAQESDATGQYVAEYRRSPTGVGVEKAKLRYLQIESSGEPLSLGSGTRIDLDAKATFALGAGNWPETMDAKQLFVLETGAPMPAVVAELRLSVRHLDLQVLTSLAGAHLRDRQGLRTSPLAAPSRAADDAREQDRKLVAGRSIDDLLAAVRRGHERAFERLGALLRLEPSLAERTAAAVRAEDDASARSTLLAALTAADNPHAVAALASISEDRGLAPDLRADAIGSLGLVETQTSDGVEALRALVKDPDGQIRSTAVLALGNAVRGLQKSGEGEPDSVLRELIDGFRSAQTPDEQILYLYALGNTRDPQILGVIEEALRSSEVAVRVAAVEALARVPDPGADRLLASELALDPAPKVRQAAVTAASARPLMPLLPALKIVLETDPASMVRAATVSMLGPRRAELPAVTALLQWTSEHDPKAEIRTAALAYLGGGAPR